MGVGRVAVVREGVLGAVGARREKWRAGALEPLDGGVEWLGVVRLRREGVGRFVVGVLRALRRAVKDVESGVARCDGRLVEGDAVVVGAVGVDVADGCADGCMMTEEAGEEPGVEMNEADVAVVESSADMMLEIESRSC